MPNSPPTVVGLGPFKLDLKAGELQRDGRHVRLQEQPFRVLLMLVDRPGEVVTREELQKRLWPNDTIVEFDHSINAAIKRLRDALGDSAETPRYVETVARRGYRLLVPVDAIEAPGSPPAAGKSGDADLAATGESGARYRLREKLGAGGMGEVYKAEDLKLGRLVALKFLPEDFASDPKALDRFRREAQLASALNHPHICAIYDVGEMDGRPFIAMELVEGETLAARLVGLGPYPRAGAPALPDYAARPTQGSALPIEKVLEYGIEIAGALAAAHRLSIIHRDLKPHNIMLTKSGTKLLDFGLAKLMRTTGWGPQALLWGSPLAVNEHGQDAPSTAGPGPAAHSITAQGAILGTLHYMAPEQLEGQAADARSDIFAFGCVLYEMATGKKAFAGESSAQVMAAILQNEPQPISAVQSLAPAALERAVKKCLRKDPDERWQTARDIADELKWIAEGGSQAGLPAPVPSRRKSRERLAWSVAAVFLMAALALGGWAYFRRTQEDTQAVRFFVSPPETWSLRHRLALTGAAPSPLAVSPDGRRLAFVGVSADGKSLLWVRSLDALIAQPLAGTDGATSPFWSPDSRFLGFFADGELRKIEVSGGHPITLCDAPDVRGGSWSQDGVIVFAPIFAALQKVSEAGGVPTEATVLGEGETVHVSPFFLPDGRHFLYWSYTGTGASQIFVASLDSPNRKFLLNSDSVNVVYTQGHLLFLRQTTLMAQPFDARRLALTGEAFPIAEQIQTEGNPYLGVFSASPNGVLAYQTGTAEAGSRLVWFDRAGKQIGILGDAAAYSSLVLSPDGKRASVSIPNQAGNARDIWLYDVGRGLKTRFTVGPFALRSLWSPDGGRIVFNSTRKGHFDLYQKASNGAGAEEVLLEDNHNKSPVSWSPDGRFILYGTGSAPTGADLFVLPLSGDRKPFPFLQTQFNEYPGKFSPDGRWVAYYSNESGRFEVYVAPFPGPGGKWLISTGGGVAPRWSHDGKEIFYLSPDNKLIAAAVNGIGARFEVGAVKPLFQTRAVTFDYDVSPDGRRFLINTALVQTATQAPITVVLNWTSGLNKK